jgi:hypothetical protein
MKYLVWVFLALPHLASACVCIAPRSPPTADEVRAHIDAYFKAYQSVLRVRAIKDVSVARSAPQFQFLVIAPWKGSYKIGDVLVVRSEEMLCDQTVRVGDELLVGFNSIAEANFTMGNCPSKFPQTKRRLEDQYLRMFSRRDKRARSQ